MPAVKGRRYDMALPYSQDLDFFLPLLMEHAYGVMPAPLYVYEYQGNPSLPSILARLRGQRRIFAKYLKHYPITALWRVMANASGATTAAVPAALDTSFLKWVPKDAVDFSSGGMNPLSIYDTLVRGLRAYDQEFAGEMLTMLAESEKQIGFTVRDDLFGSLGDHWIMWSMPVGTIQSAPEVALLVKVVDEAKVAKVLMNLPKLTDGQIEVEKSEKRGIEVYQVRVNIDPMQGMGGFNPFKIVEPVVAFKNGYLVGSLSAYDIKRVFQRMEREDDPKGDIRSNKEYVAVAGDIPANVQSLSFTDWKAKFESYYQIVCGLLAFVPFGEDVPIDMALLPESGTLTRHLYGAVSWSRTTPEGDESVTISPFGVEAEVLVGSVVAVAMAWLTGMRTARGF
jgi:hypothetical protein